MTLSRNALFAAAAFLLLLGPKFAFDHRVSRLRSEADGLEPRIDASLRIAARLPATERKLLILKEEIGPAPPAPEAAAKLAAAQKELAEAKQAIADLYKTKNALLSANRGISSARHWALAMNFLFALTGLSVFVLARRQPA